MRILIDKIKTLAFSILFVTVSIGCKSKNKDTTKDKQKVTSTNILSAVIDSINSEIKNGDYGLIDRFIVIQNDEFLADFRYEQDYETIAQKYDTTNHQYNFNSTDWHPYYKKK